MNPRTILEIDDLVLNLGGKNILNHLSMDFRQGSIHAVVGPNGAGKSTLASTIMGLSGYTDFTGDIRFNGKSLKNMNISERAASGITLSWQEPARYEGLCVKKFILAGAKDKSEDTVNQALDIVGLSPALYSNRKVDKTLSGGERKRIELASILAMEPNLVIMDEPDSGIDIEALNRIFNTMGILRDKGSTIILITHSMEVLKHAEHGFLMCHGHLLTKGSIEKLTKLFGSQCVPCPHKNIPDEEVSFE
ncbi:ATP-binding cassette domain-containing protein [bacterium]|nr:ATP-binding cassette domain-containing protein [bacterium]